MYESSMLFPFGADEELTDSGFMTAGPGVTETVVVVDCDDFGFAFGIAASLLTRTDAGI